MAKSGPLDPSKAVLPPARLFISGGWQSADEGGRFVTENPATEESLTEVASATAVDLDRAVGSAKEALSGEWGKASGRERGKLLWRIADALESRIDEFALVETLDNGKPIFESRWVDLPAAISALRYFAGWADKIHGETIGVDGPFEFAYTLREPMGVVAAITPWNFPLIQALWKIAPALACGNAVIHKPASSTPLTALKFAQLACDSGLPPGALNVLPGGGSTIGGHLVAHPEVAKITFTGSTEVGRGLMRDAARNVKRVTLELGGKSPNIVFADADLDRAVKGAYNGIFYGKGEVCAAGSRLFVERSVHDEFVNALTKRTARLLPGDPLDPETRMGALVSREQRDSVLAYVEIGQAEGASLASGGRAATVNGRGYFMHPTIFTDVDNGMRIAQEEIFGPVLVVIPFDEPEEAIRLANDNEYGLAAGVWTRDIGKAHRVASRLRAGTVWLNQYNWYDSGAPFGGYKQSGFGRELGREAISYYTECKTVFVGQ